MSNQALVKANKEKAFLTKNVRTPFNSKQLLHILQKTPKDHVYQRIAKGGGTWDYVTGVYVKKVLNYVFGWLWSFEIKEHGREKDLAWVLGRLTINDRIGNPLIVKEQFGRAEIKYKKGTKDELDYGNDLKAAATDALKKCASELGIASDIYGKNEFKEIQIIDKGFVGPDEVETLQPKIQKPIETENLMIKKLKEKLNGKTDEEKFADLQLRTGIKLKTFKITDKHAAIIIAELMRVEVKNKGGRK